MRSNTWVAPPMPRVHVNAVDEETPTTDGTLEESVKNDMENVHVQQYYYKPHEIKQLTNDSEFHLLYRKKIEYGTNRGLVIFYKDSDVSKMAQMYITMEMKKRLNNHPQLCEKPIPKWSVGCRRLTPGDGYLEALIEPKVDPVYDDIASVDKSSFTRTAGEHFEVDAIICATSFDTSWTPHFELIGLDGVRLKDSWSPPPNCYFGISAPGVP